MMENYLIANILFCIALILLVIWVAVLDRKLAKMKKVLDGLSLMTILMNREGIETVVQQLEIIAEKGEKNDEREHD